MTLTSTREASATITRHRRTSSRGTTNSTPSPSTDGPACSDTAATGQKTMGTVLKYYFNRLPTATRTVLKRAFASLLLLSGFGYLIYGGPIPIIVTMLLAQYQCAKEVMAIAFAKYGVAHRPAFQRRSLYFLFAANFFYFGEHIAEHFYVFYAEYEALRMLHTYHRFVAFCVYFVGIIWFVLTLEKGYYRKQFSLLAWTHVIMLVVVTQAYFVVRSVFEGMIWFVISIGTITCNDIMAYICGRFFGRMPLITISPKKTWEGFLGGGFFTILITLFVAHSLCAYDAFVCPMEYRNVNGTIAMYTQCERSPIFQRTTLVYNLATYPFVIHAFFLALFGSVVAPFGGFFASGFKRAFKVKDFGDAIPGHGGIMDRFDCQLIMLTFVHVYISSFIRTPSVEKMLEQVVYLDSEHQLQFYYAMQSMLRNNGILPAI